jgi:hypothetical protein
MPENIQDKTVVEEIKKSEVVDETSTTDEVKNKVETQVYTRVSDGVLTSVEATSQEEAEKKFLNLKN